MTCSRVWMGPEREGFAKGVMTLFYEDRTPDGFEVIEYLTRYRAIKRVYLGSGRQYPVSITNTDVLTAYAQLYKIEIVVEVDIKTDITFPESWTVIGVCGPQLRFTHLKTDDLKKVKVYKITEPSATDLHDLSDGLFSCDTLIKG